ncbi:MAG: hypothetical protein M3139_11430 [Bacteroidota bacterium]|nr:hypothetical protein [Bacteroidota bacterium]
MAKPIKETPILKGKDAKNFIQQHNAKTNSNPNKLEKDRIMRNYNYFKAAEKIDRHIPC